MSNYPDNMNWDAWANANGEGAAYPALERWHCNKEVRELLAKLPTVEDGGDEYGQIVDMLEAWRDEAIGDEWNQHESTDWLMEELQAVTTTVDELVAAALEQVA